MCITLLIEHAGCCLAKSDACLSALVLVLCCLLLTTWSGRVRWVGYGEDANTWESQSSLAGAKILLDEFNVRASDYAQWPGHTASVVQLYRLTMSGSRL